MAMPRRKSRPRASRRHFDPGELLLALAAANAALMATWGAYLALQSLWLLATIAALLGALPLALAVVARGRTQKRKLLRPIAQLAASVRGLAEDPSKPLPLPEQPELSELGRNLAALVRRLTAPRPAPTPLARPQLTRSGLFAPADDALSETDPESMSWSDIASLDMVNRLEPTTLRWLDSSAAEQRFLGWTLEELRAKTFPEIVHSDDRSLAFEQLQAALYKGEAHGLIYRIKTARGESRAIEMNVSVRYGPDAKPSHLRCHVTDVTAKLRASKELRRRTRELTLVNQLLRRTNRELQELKDRYSDLYQNAPAMYFSLDVQGNVIECNNTLLRTLGYRRNELIGRPYTVLLPDARKTTFAPRFAEFLRTGYVEVESRWKKADGGLIDVWVTGTAVRGLDGKVRHSRSVAQDITARRALEAELQQKNQRLAQTIEELSGKNKELDEFTYVVSHDLQEPVRTLIAFSEFLLKDCSERLDAAGKEYVGHLADAARRMRALISDLLALSRAGRVTADFARVSLQEVVALVKADLAELIRAKKGEIRSSGPLPTIWGDRNRLVQLFANLASNGLKYNRSAEPRVEIGTQASEQPGWLTLFVRDNGIGIDPEYHAKIFQVFRRLHARDEFEGTGAGLAICQKIVQAHGGRIWVESQAGQGSTFFLTLPTQPAEAPHLQAEILNAP